MPEPTVVLDKVRRYWEYAGADVDRAHELYHDDAVLEFPQSGERFEGVASFTEWRRQYPAEVRYRVRRVTAREDLAVVEVSASYNGGPWQYGVQLLEFRDDKVARERIYVTEGWEAPSGGPVGARPRPRTRLSEALNGRVKRSRRVVRGRSRASRSTAGRHSRRAAVRPRPSAATVDHALPRRPGARAPGGQAGPQGGRRHPGAPRD